MNPNNCPVGCFNFSFCNSMEKFYRNNYSIKGIKCRLLEEKEEEDRKNGYMPPLYRTFFVLY